MPIIDFTRPISSLSVLTGWRTVYSDTNEQIGPSFNKVTDLWKWQRAERESQQTRSESTQSIVQDALVAAKDASVHLFNKMGQQDTFPCGFAWVDVKVTRTNSRLAKELIELGFSKSHIPKTLFLWNPGSLKMYKTWMSSTKEPERWQPS